MFHPGETIHHQIDFTSETTISTFKDNTKNVCVLRTRVKRILRSDFEENTIDGIDLIPCY